MLGKTHFIMGLTGGMVISLASPMTLENKMVFETCCMVGSLIPDIDLPVSTMGRLCKPLSTLFNKVAGHRGKDKYQNYVGGPLQGIFHSPFLWIVLSGIIMHFTKSAPIALGFLVGCIMHLLQDFMTISGIPLLYPFKRKNYHLLKMKSGSFLEYPVTFCLVALVFAASSLTTMLPF